MKKLYAGICSHNPLRRLWTVCPIRLNWNADYLIYQKTEIKFIPSVSHDIPIYAKHTPYTILTVENIRLVLVCFLLLTLVSGRKSEGIVNIYSSLHQNQTQRLHEEFALLAGWTL